MLIAYASKHESTHEVADAIAEALRDAGHDADVRLARDVEDLSPYRAIVLGGSLYMGRWHPDARRFLRRHRHALADLPLAVFALGPLHDTEEEIASSRAQLERALARVPEVRPTEIAIFGGRIDPASLRFPFTHMPASDARNWDAIRAWAEALPARLELERRRLAAY